MHTITQLDMTCGACPSQWEGRTSDGRFLYGRYRWGFLRVSISHSRDSAIIPDEGDLAFETLFAEQVGDELDGSMSTPEMLKHLRNIAVLDLASAQRCHVAKTQDEHGKERFFVEDPWGDWIGDAHDTYESALEAAKEETRKLRES